MKMMRKYIYVVTLALSALNFAPSTASAVPFDATNTCANTGTSSPSPEPSPNNANREGHERAVDINQ